MNRHEYSYIQQRLGYQHAQKRLRIEKHHEARKAGPSKKYFPSKRLNLTSWGIRSVLKISGLYGKGRENAARVDVRHNIVRSPHVPHPFSGFSILHLSDLHVDISGSAMEVVTELIPTLKYDICVLTGDYRGQTFGPIEDTIKGLSSIVKAINSPIYGVFGNHDSIHLLPGMENLGIRVLLNETEVLELSQKRIHLAGIDDAHFYNADNIEKVALRVPREEFSVLLSHTPEVYKQAAHAEFNFMLSGHTHGGQICLPGSVPITLSSKRLPRRFGAGAWKHQEMQGYTSVGAGTSVVPVRFNCAPEITLHRLMSE